MQARIQDFLTEGVDCRGGPSFSPPLRSSPSPSLLPPFPLPFLSPSLPPSLPLEVGPLNPARGSGGAL